MFIEETCFINKLKFMYIIVINIDKFIILDQVISNLFSSKSKLTPMHYIKRNDN